MNDARTANLFAALSGEVMRRIDLAAPRHANATDSASAALNLLGSVDGASNGALARALKLSHAATARLVEKLVIAGWVTTCRGTDRRSVLLTLTEAGRSQVRDIVEPRVAVAADILAALNADQQAALVDIAETLLLRLAGNFDDAVHICRLCDDHACPPDRCPVHLFAMASVPQPTG